MSLFKALVFTLFNSTGYPQPVEIGPFTSQTQCIEAARTVMGPDVRSVKTSDSGISGIVNLPYPSSLGNMDDRSAVMVIRCYEVHHP